MKRRHVLLAGALALSAWLALVAEPAPPNLVEAVPGPVRSVRKSAGASAIDGHSKEKTVDLVLDREQLIGGARSGSGAAQLFGSKSWAIPPPPPQAPPPPPPPSAPPLPYQYLGKKFEDNVWEIYLGRNDQTFIVREQGMVENDYRVESIRPPNMTLTYLPLKQTQTLAIGEAQ